MNLARNHVLPFVVRARFGPSAIKGSCMANPSGEESAGAKPDTSSEAALSYPPQPEDRIEAALRDIEPVISDAPEARSDRLAVEQDWLITALRNRGHVAAAAGWAIERAIQMGWFTREYRQLPSYAMEYNGIRNEGGFRTVAVLVTTPKLWLGCYADKRAAHDTLRANLPAALREGKIDKPDLKRLADDRQDSAGARPVEPATGADDVVCSTDFRSVRWFGALYSFTPKQAPVVRLLVENFRAGTPDVGDETLLLAVDPEAPPARLSTLFRDHAAWGTMIVAGGSKGTHRLRKPAEENP